MRIFACRNIVGLVILLLNIAGPAFGQQYILKNFGLAEGLPSRVVYDVAMDAEGLLWIAAEGGLLTYNGNQFVIDPIQQLAHTEILRIDIMQDGSLLCLDLSGRLQNIQGTQVTELMPGEEVANFNGVLAKENARGEIMILLGRKYWIYTKKNPTNRKLIRQGNLNGYLPNGLELISDTIFVVNSEREIFLLDNFKTRKYAKPKALHFVDSFTKNWKGKLVFNARNKLIELNPTTLSTTQLLTEITQQIKGEVLDFWQIGDALWIDTRNEVYQAKMQDEKWEITKVLKDVIPGKIIKDWQGNIWITSVTDGLFFIPDQAELVNSVIMEFSIDKVTTDHDGNIYVYTGGSILKKYNADLKLKSSLRIEDAIYKSYFLEYDKYANQLFLGTNTTASYSTDLQRKRVYSSGASSKSLSVDPHGNIVITDATGVVINNGKTKKRIFEKRTYSNLIYDDSTIYIGSIDGLYEYQQGSSEVKFLNNVKGDLRCLEKDQHQRIWVGTQGDGIRIWDKEKNEIIAISQKDGLLDNRCKKILIDDDYAWVSSAKGISKINIDQPEDILTFTNEIGLPVGGINDFAQRKDDIVVATDNGLLLIDKKIGEKKDSLNLKYLSIEYNGQQESFNDSIMLNKDQRNLKINFQGIDYKNFSAISYLYKLEGVDLDWNSTQSNSIQYSALPAGKFNFHLKASSPNGNVVALKPVFVEVPKKFKETIWYSIVIFLFGSTVVGALIWYFFNNYKVRNQFEKQINEARLSAIRSKMNPHFVFNAINSIQDFVMNNNKRDANRYLVKFSRLMRNVLNASTKQFISLEEELNTLELYLSLEQLRFDHDLKTSIQVDDKIKKSDVLLPPMLLQPHVENALKHGLMHKLGTGHLIIRIFNREDYLIFEIEDDGVGRISAAKFRNQRRAEEHVSHGTQLVKDQISVVNKITGKVNAMKILDLYDENDNAVGTKVIIKFYESKFKASLAKAGQLTI